MQCTMRRLSSSVAQYTYKIYQYLIQSHQRCLCINRVWAYFEPNSMDTEPPKMARYIALCRFWTKFENLECEIHENRIFSNFLRVVCTRKKICSIVYLLRFFKICLSANNPEEFELLNVGIVHCSAKSMQLKHLANFTAHHPQRKIEKIY